MKWFLALNEVGLVYYEDMVCAAVRSAQLNTSLKPHLLWDGPEGTFVDWMRAQDVMVTPCRTPLYGAIRTGEAHLGFVPHTADGAFCVSKCAASPATIPLSSIPTVMCSSYRNRILAAIDPVSSPRHQHSGLTDRSMVNTGVMMMNVQRFRNDYDDLHALVRGHWVKNFDAYDQGELNIFL